MEMDISHLANYSQPFVLRSYSRVDILPNSALVLFSPFYFIIIIVVVLTYTTCVADLVDRYIVKWAM